jgi:MoaA/NifB/PqqE/SkfB family radical SAM enzyme
MLFFVRDPFRRAAAREQFMKDCARIKEGRFPERVLETDIYVTKRCNLKCSYCYFEDYFNDPLHPLPEDPPLETLKTLVDRLSGKTYCLVILGGEPFSRNDLVEFLTYARSKDIFSIRISTNGLYLSQRKEALPLIDCLSVSFDCTRAKQYPAIMARLLRDLADLKNEIGHDLPQTVLAWTTSPDDDFEQAVKPLLDYAVQHEFLVKFLPVKIDQRVDWDSHRKIVLKALEYAGQANITNQLFHTQALNPASVLDNCLQGIQYYIDFEGYFMYPCDEYPHQKTGSIFEYSTDQLMQHGLDRFGVYPQTTAVCAHCPSGCHSDNSYIFRYPQRQLLYLRSDQTTKPQNESLNR